MNQKIKYSVTQTTPEQTKSACIAVAVFQNKRLSEAAARLDKASGGYIKNLLQQGDFNANTGQSLVLYDLPKVQSKRVLLIGCGKEKSVSHEAYRKIHHTLIRESLSLNISDITSFLSEVQISETTKADTDDAWYIRQAVATCESSLYRFDQCKAQEKKSTKIKLRKIQLGFLKGKTSPSITKATKEGQAIGEGMNVCKTLGNLPGNICTPDYLAKQARSLQKTFSTIKTTVLTEAAMTKLGMHSLLSVGRGSQEASRLAIMEYRQGKAGGKPVVLVGKGITFDSGGISLKPGAKMDEMKFDMCGAASVIGVMHACASMQLKANVIGIIACAENMPSSQATKPGDIVTSMSGRTIEILNTDAEGRLVLCDALTYAERYKPSAVIDIATLTGACIVALGRQPSGLLGNNEKLIEALKQAGETSGDRVWQLPLWPEYRQQLKSNFADVANIGGPEAGTITAAAFLSYFTESFSWAHLDIAGTAWRSAQNKGATGRPVPLLVEYLMSNHSSKK